jgi:hypothetical protein
MNLRDNRALTQQVDARNRLNAKVNELAPLLQEVLKPYIGSKVIKVTPYRNWTKKVDEALEKVTSGLPGFRSDLHGYRVTYDICGYNVYITLDTTYRNVGEAVGYLKVELCLCSLTGDQLSAVNPITERRTDYTMEEVAEKRAKLLELEDQVNALKSELREFSR